MPFDVGENVGPYRITEQLGQGGMATVYKAYHAALDRYVALKVLHPAFKEDPNFQERFQREARLVAKLDHPNIVPVYDYAEYEGRPYLVMKFIQGETLKARMARGPLTGQEVRQVVDAVGAALTYAHKRGVLHRDVKPSNVLIATDGQMYLADFGLARIAISGESTLSSDMILGTPQYISPEQAMGKRELDEGTDIYSFGVMTYEMVVGRVPFTADTPFSIIHDHIYSPLPMPRQINPQVPEGVERVLLKALAKERGDRYQDVAAMVKAFDAVWVASDVPMRTTTVTLPSPPSSPTEEVSKPGVAAPPPDLGIPGAATFANKGKSTRKGYMLWLPLGGSLLLVACCVLGFLAWQSGQLPLTFLSTAPVVDTLEASPTPLQTRPAAATPTATLPAPVVTAQAGAAAHPDDPQANLELALAYWDAEMPRPALESLNKAADLAGQDEDFIIHAGQAFADRQAWVAAAGMYLRALKLHGPALPAPEPLTTSMHEAVYKAAFSPEMPAYLPFESIGRVDQALMLVAQARYAYYNGDKAQAHELLNQAKDLTPSMYEVQLLEAEFDFNEGRMNEARPFLNALTANLSTPDWIKELAQSMKRRLP